MDLRLFWGVVKRYKRLSIGGSVLAVLLAVLAYSLHGSVTYEASAELLITQGSGATYGQASSKALQLGAPNYMSSLSPVYAGIANGDAVKNAVRALHVPGTVVATEGVDQNTGLYTPFVNLTADAPTVQDAETLVKHAIATFKSVVAQMETASGVSATSGVTLEVVKSGLPPVLASGHKLTIPMLVLVAVLAATILLLFSLENRDPVTAVALGRLSAAPSPAAAASNGTAMGHAAASTNGTRDRSAVMDRIMRP